MARATPERIVKVPIHPFLGLQPYQGRELAFGIGLPKELVRDFVKIAQGLSSRHRSGQAARLTLRPTPWPW